MNKWKMTRLSNPPKDILIWGYDVFYDNLHTCKWDGKRRCDDESPRLTSEDTDGTDYAFDFWMEKDPEPKPPNVEHLYEEEEEEEETPVVLT